MKKGLVSIIIPIYNVEKYVRDSLESVFNQTYKKIELIIIDDRGTDNSMDIVSEVMQKCPFEFSIITHEKNYGVSEARNMGIKKASGEYIYFLDSDDLITSDCIEILYNHMIEYNADVVIGGYTFLYEKDFNTVLNDAISFKNDDVKCAFVGNDYENGYVCNALYKKKLVTDNEIFFEKDIKLGEDALWIMLLQFKARKILKVDAKMYFYRITPQSSCMSLCKKENYVNNLTLIIEKLFNYIESENFSNIEKGVIISRIRSYKNGLYSSIVLDKIKKEDINYNKLRQVKVNSKDIIKSSMSKKRKIAELILSIIPILESYYIYTGIFKIKSLLNRK